MARSVENRWSRIAGASTLTLITSLALAACGSEETAAPAAADKVVAVTQKDPPQECDPASSVLLFDDAGRQLFCAQVTNNNGAEVYESPIVGTGKLARELVYNETVVLDCKIAPVVASDAGQADYTYHIAAPAALIGAHVPVFHFAEELFDDVPVC